MPPVSNADMMLSIPVTTQADALVAMWRIPVDKLANFKPMSKLDHSEYEIQAKPFHMALKNMMSIKHERTKDDFRSSANAVIRFLISGGKQKLLQKYRPDGASDSEIETGFIQGSEAYAIALKDKVNWKSNPAYFTQGRPKEWFPTSKFEDEHSMYVLIYILQARDLRLDGDVSVPTGLAGIIENMSEFDAFA